MSYPRDLDEVSEKELVSEISRRKLLRRKGNCDYCGRPAGCIPACRFPERHGKKVKKNVAPVG